MSNTKLGCSTELSGAILTDRIPASDIGQFKTDPKAYAAEAGNIDLGGANVSVVENNAGTVHLALPYYSALDNLSGEMLSDSDMSEAAGGEFVIGLIVLSIAGATTGAAVLAGAATGTVAAGQAAHGKNIDGSSK